MIIPIFISRGDHVPYWECWYCGNSNHPFYDVCEHCGEPEGLSIKKLIKKDIKEFIEIFNSMFVPLLGKSGE